jgi:hypothetical protein
VVIRPIILNEKFDVAHGIRAAGPPAPYILSTIMAPPMPPPTQRVARP